MAVNRHARPVAEVRRALVDPTKVCEQLGIAKGARPQSRGGLTIRCPMHAEKTPSCSVSRGADGTIRVRCFGCGWSGDVLTLVAAVRGLDIRHDFHDVLRAASEVGDLYQLADELRGSVTPSLRILPPMPEREPERKYPPSDEVLAVWNAAAPVAAVEACRVPLAGRGLSPDPDLARALSQQPLPGWARYQGASWIESGHRIVLPVFDAQGALRSLRAWQCDRNATGPKRLPPVGHRATGLVLANDPALRMLRSPATPVRLLIAEGEPDYLSLCERYPGTTVIGVVSGSWNQEFADQIGFGSVVCIRTHHDEAGARYAETIIKTLAGRAVMKRGSK
jgi:CHC2 zinc finger